MPIDVSIDTHRRRAQIVIRDRVEIEEIISTVDQIALDPAFGPDFAILSDHRDVIEPLTPEQARTMVQRLEHHGEIMRGRQWVAIVDSPASYGMMRLMSARVDGLAIRIDIVDSPEEADRLLDHGAPRIEG
jgi:hypothetical protein